MKMDNREEGVWRELISISDRSEMPSVSKMQTLAHFCAKVAGVLPGRGLYLLVKRVLVRMNRRYLAGLCDLERFSRGRFTNEEVRSYRKVMRIRKGYYDYDFFNVCFLNNVLALCLKAVSEGYIPRVEILNASGENIWEKFFEQPYADLPTQDLEVMDYDEKALEAFPWWDDIYIPGQRKQYELLYARFARLNAQTHDYAKQEAENLLQGRKVLGVLCRGTDYTATRPKEHPVQPEPTQIMERVREVYRQGGYDHIYLATEDGEYDRLFRKEYGDRLLINKRNYYDQVFSDQNLKRIIHVHFDRKDDDYLKGLEYISSLQILAHCDGLVAGNCGGTQAAVLWNGDRYREAHVFDAGEYA